MFATAPAKRSRRFAKHMPVARHSMNMPPLADTANLTRRCMSMTALFTTLGGKLKAVRRSRSK